MPKVFFLNEQLDIEVKSGQTIKEAAEAKGINIFRGLWPDFNCGTRGICGRCKVWVFPKSPTAINPPTGWEKFRPSIEGAVRLACQCHVQGEVDVRTRPGGPAVVQTLEWAEDPRPFKWKARANQSTTDDEEGEEKPKPKPAPRPVAAKPAVAKAAPVAKPDTAKPDVVAKPDAAVADAAKPDAAIAKPETVAIPVVPATAPAEVISAAPVAVPEPIAKKSEEPVPPTV